jgi:polysaccharide export outer membrane protein
MQRSPEASRNATPSPFRGGRLRAAWRHCAAAALCAVALTGCIVPKDGPTALEVRSSAEVLVEDSGRLSYAFIKLTPLTARQLQAERHRPVLFSQLASMASPTEARVGRSDTISITIFEAASGGLFIPSDAGSRPGNFVQVPNQEVDGSGNIVVPYGGVIRALGRTPREIAADIEARLRQRAIEPQVVVTLGDRTSQAVSILGDVNTPTTLSLRPGGLRLLAGIARAGGAKFAGHETIVTLHRKGRTENALLTSIVRDPTQNIQLAPDDVVYLTHESRIFLAFGATPAPGSIGGQNNRRFVFEDENLTLAEAIAKAGGLLPETADPRAVFLFRYVPRRMLAAAGVDVSAYTAADVPTVFQVDLGQAEGYFIANHFFMKHKDIIFVSESPSTDLVKFLNIINSATNPALSASTISSNLRSLR